MSDTAVTIEAAGEAVEFESVEGFTEAVEAVTERLSGTDYVAVSLSKFNGQEWLDTPPRLGDKMTLEVQVTVVEVGKKLTDDGIQATAKLETSGVIVVDG